MAVKGVKIVYKNHCTPQEYITNNSRWYLDSDCGRKLSGVVELDMGILESNVTYTPEHAVTTATGPGGTAFLYIKNMGGGNGDSLLISFDAGVTYRVALNSGECFVSKLSASPLAVRKWKAESTNTTVEYITGDPL